MRTAYDEVDDEFSFTRTRSKRAKTKPAVDTSTEAVAQLAQPEPVSASSAVEPPRRKPRKTLPVTPERDEAGGAPRQRRSKRLSGESDRTVSETLAPATSAPEPKPTIAAPAIQTPTPAVPSPRTQRSPNPEHAPASLKLHVEKKRRVTKIALPFADTPIIRRNKEMRKTSAEQHRRSSSGMRGKRASSLIDTGTSNGTRLCGTGIYQARLCLLTLAQQLCHTPKSRLGSFTSTSRKNSQSRDECASCLCGAVIERCRKSRAAIWTLQSRKQGMLVSFMAHVFSMAKIVSNAGNSARNPGRTTWRIWQPERHE